MTDFQRCNKCGLEMQYDSRKYILMQFEGDHMVPEFPRVHICPNCKHDVEAYCNTPLRRVKRKFGVQE